MNGLRTILKDSEAMISFGTIVALTIVAAILVGRFLQRKINRHTNGHRVDVTSFIFLRHMIVTIIYFLGFGWALLTLPITHTFAHSLLAGAGASTLILGFASQQLFKNLISGVFLVVSRPFRINDLIEFQGKQGKVIEINLNSTIIEDVVGNKTIIPSSLILTDKVTILNPNTTGQP